jgi:alkanesulfonate monooxygenase SsuD/methylene tetrahydromethanopterin reductase-like flavin-dependent oxidoreductase (luciferase family)
VCGLHLPQHQLVLVVKQVAEGDVLTGGRLRLGVGVCWNSVESAAMGQDFHMWGARIEEQTATLWALWTQERLTFAGRWHHISDGGLNPLPVEQPIPIWMASESAPAIRRAGWLADGYIRGRGSQPDGNGPRLGREDGD